MPATLNVAATPAPPALCPPAARPRRGHDPALAAGQQALASRDAGVRVRPVPLSEPLTDDELHTANRALPADLTTGVRVRRAGRLGGAGARRQGVVATTRTTASDAVPPAHPAAAGDNTAGGAVVPSVVGTPVVLLAPEAVLTVVTPSLHLTAPGTSAMGTAATGTAAAGASTSSDPSAPAPGHADVDESAASDPAAPDPVAARELRIATRRLLSTCVEVIGGFRPVAQLRPYCAPERFDAIVNRLLRPTGAGRGHGATRGSVVARGATQPRPGRPSRGPSPDRVTVRRVQICDVMDGIAELAVVMSRRGKIWAMAMRLERSRGRWQCMHMEVL